MTKRWLSVEEISGNLEINPDTIYKWITRNRMPAHKLGQLWKFLSTEVDSWVKADKAAQNIDLPARKPRPTKKSSAR